MANAESQAIQALDKYLDKLIDEIFTLSQQNLVKNGTSDTGQLLKTANINRELLKKEIVYPVNYAVWIEYGTQPHAVSVNGIKNLEGWAKRKLGLSEKEAKSASYAIANKIKAEGTKAQPFLRPAWDEVMVRSGFV